MRKALTLVWLWPLLAACGRVAEGQPDSAVPGDTETLPDTVVDGGAADSQFDPDGCPTNGPLGCNPAIAGKICTSEAWSCQSSAGYRIIMCRYTPGGWLWGNPTDGDSGINYNRYCDAAKQDGGVNAEGCPAGPTYVGCNEGVAGKTCSTRPWACRGVPGDMYQLTECRNTVVGWIWEPKGPEVSCGADAGGADGG